MDPTLLAAFIVAGAVIIAIAAMALLRLQLLRQLCLRGGVLFGHLGQPLAECGDLRVAARRALGPDSVTS